MSLLRRHRNEFGLLLAIALVLGTTVFFGTGYDSAALVSGNLEMLAHQTSLLGIFSLGAAVVIISGGIDLSAGSMIAFSATIFASVCLAMGPEPGTVTYEIETRGGVKEVANISRTDALGPGVYAAAGAVTLAAAIAVGTFHTWLITALGLPPFVATLASLVGLRSLAKLLVSQVTRAIEKTSSSQIAVRHEAFEILKSWSVVLGLFLGVAILLWFTLSRTVVGRHLYAVGGNEEAARLSGIPVARTKWFAYCTSSVTASLAGIIYCSYVSVAVPDQLAIGYELNAIAAAVVGGCSLAGGVGTVVGVGLGALFLRVVIDAIAKLVKSGADDVEGLIVGLLVVAAVTVNEATARSARRRDFFPGALGIASVVSLSLTVGLTAALMVSDRKLLTGGSAAVAALLLAGGRAVHERRRRAVGPAT